MVRGLDGPTPVQWDYMVTLFCSDYFCCVFKPLDIGDPIHRTVTEIIGGIQNIAVEKLGCMVTSKDESDKRDNLNRDTCFIYTNRREYLQFKIGKGCDKNIYSSHNI